MTTFGKSTKTLLCATMIMLSGCDANRLDPRCALQIIPAEGFFPLTGGMAIESNVARQPGSLGIIVHKRDTGRPMILTNCHVVDPNPNENGFPAYCRSPYTSGLIDNPRHVVNSLEMPGNPVIGRVMGATTNYHGDDIGNRGNDWALVGVDNPIIPGYDANIINFKPITGNIIEATSFMPVMKLNRVNDSLLYKQGYLGEVVYGAVLGHGAGSSAMTLTGNANFGPAGNSGSIILEYGTQNLVGLFHGEQSGTYWADSLPWVLSESQANAIIYDPKNNPVSLFRFRHATDNAHLYTANWLEIGTIGPAAASWIFESAMGALMRYEPRDPDNWLAFHRFLNPTTNDQAYTTEESEFAGNGNYCYQGITGWIPRNAINGKTILLYRYKHSGTGEHFYTIYPEELSTATGWELDGPGTYNVLAKHGPPDPPAVWPGPVDADINIDPSCSYASITINGATAQTAISGKMSATITPTCHDPLCVLTVHSLTMTGTDFNLGNQRITEISASTRDHIQADWRIDNTFQIPAYAMPTSISFKLNGQPSGVTVSNNSSPAYGTIRRDYTNMTLVADVAGNGVSTHFSLCGQLVASPPSAAITPVGPFECDSPNGAHVQFSSASSFDRDNDIIQRSWSIDGTSVASNAMDISQTLSIGEHMVNLTVTDSRAARSSVDKVVQVIDTQPPVISNIVAPTCLFPPNHKMVLLQIGRDIVANVEDQCGSEIVTSIASVKSNQDILDSGSGTSVIDYKFGPNSVCLRAERAGTTMTPRNYTVTINARDRNGNRTQREIVISVPHDQGPPGKCNSDAGLVVADDDPRCLQ